MCRLLQHYASGHKIRRRLCLVKIDISLLVSEIINTQSHHLSDDQTILLQIKLVRLQEEHIGNCQGSHGAFLLPDSLKKNLTRAEDCCDK